MSPSDGGDLFHVMHKVPVGDSPYVRAKQVQVSKFKFLWVNLILVIWHSVFVWFFFKISHCLPLLLIGLYVLGLATQLIFYGKQELITNSVDYINADYLGPICFGEFVKTRKKEMNYEVLFLCE